MQTIILGSTPSTPTELQNGEIYQPFLHAAHQKGVSRKHASITIDDNGCWWIEDSWSTNGTYIRDENGNFRRIGCNDSPGKCIITPMTFIRLGAEDSTSCSFFARQAYLYGDYDEDFIFIKNKIEELNVSEKQSKKKIKQISFFLQFILPLPIALIIPYILKQFNIVINGLNIGSIVGGIGVFGGYGVLSRMMRFAYNPQEKNKEIEKEYKQRKKHFVYCPNPNCNHKLSDTDIELMRCETCKIKHS